MSKEVIVNGGQAVVKQDKSYSNRTPLQAREGFRDRFQIFGGNADTYRLTTMWIQQPFLKIA